MTCREQIGDRKLSETRRELRYEFGYAIEYAVNTGSQDESFSGVVANISCSGLCLCSPHQLSEGQTVILKSILPVIHHKAIVRWSKKVTESSHKAGLEFI